MSDIATDTRIDREESRWNQNMRSGSRDLLAALVREHDVTPTPTAKQPITADQVRERFGGAGGILSGTEESRRILDLVSAAFNIPVDDICGDGRFEEHIVARALTAVLLSELNPEFYTSPRIGRIINRDHSSVYNAIAKFPSYCEKHPVLRDVYLMLGGCDAG